MNLDRYVCLICNHGCWANSAKEATAQHECRGASKAVQVQTDKDLPYKRGQRVRYIRGGQRRTGNLSHARYYPGDPMPYAVWDEHSQEYWPLKPKEILYAVRIVPPEHRADVRPGPRTL